MKNYQQVARATMLLLAVFSTSSGVRAHGDSGELWVTSQGTDRLFIVHGQGSAIETVPVPGLGPHITTFSPLGDYAYISGMRNGDLSILRADDRQVVQTLHLGPTLTHQAKPSPDGSVLLVTQLASMSLMSPDEKVGFGTSPQSDQIILADLTGPVASPLAALSLNPTLGIGNDEPDALSVRGNTLFVSLRASGRLAIVKVNQQTATFLQLSPPAPFNPATCGPPLPQPPNGQGGCAIHGVTVRP